MRRIKKIIGGIYDFDRGMREAGYNVRERFNVYAGTTIGVLAVPLFLRYSMHGSPPEIGWTMAIVGSVVGFPFTLTASVAGFLIGNMEAAELKGKREENRISKLEDTTELQ